MKLNQREADGLENICLGLIFLVVVASSFVDFSAEIPLQFLMAAWAGVLGYKTWHRWKFKAARNPKTIAALYWFNALMFFAVGLAMSVDPVINFEVPVFWYRIQWLILALIMILGFLDTRGGGGDNNQDDADIDGALIKLLERVRRSERPESVPDGVHGWIVGRHIN